MAIGSPLGRRITRIVAFRWNSHMRVHNRIEQAAAIPFASSAFPAFHAARQAGIQQPVMGGRPYRLLAKVDFSISIEPCKHSGGSRHGTA